MLNHVTYSISHPINIGCYSLYVFLPIAIATAVNSWGDCAVYAESMAVTAFMFFLPIAIYAFLRPIRGEVAYVNPKDWLLQPLCFFYLLLLPLQL